MSLPPLLVTLTRHKLTVALLVLEITCTFAIVCNVASMIALRSARMHQASGLAENELVLIDSMDLVRNGDTLAKHASALAALRAIASVKAAVAVDTLPFKRSDWVNSIATAPDDAPGLRGVSASAFNGTPGELSTLGLQLIEGRDFQADEYIPEEASHGWQGIDKVPATIITRALAEHLFPGQSALGRNIYASDTHPTRIVGVVDHLLRPNPLNGEGNEDAMLFPMLPDSHRITYVLRSTPVDRERILKQAVDVLNSVDSTSILKRSQTFTQLRDDYSRRDRIMLGLLAAAAAGLLLVTALGIVGLASFWVQQRRRSIGVRRAVGATRRDILRYFQIENFLIVSLGIVPGVALAYGFNHLLMIYAELPRLPAIYLLIGALVLWLVGQLAVLAPALWAASVSPVVAIRA